MRLVLVVSLSLWTVAAADPSLLLPALGGAAPVHVSLGAALGGATALPLPVFVAGLPVVVAGIALTAIKIVAGVALLVKKEQEKTYEPSYGSYHKRAAQETWREEVVEVEKLLVSAASRLDTDGCVLKLLCHLNNKQVHARTMEENVLLQLFSSYSEMLSSHDAAFLNAAADDSKSQEQEAACDEVFPRCSLGQEELGSLLRHTWPCPTITP